LPDQGSLQKISGRPLSATILGWIWSKGYDLAGLAAVIVEGDGLPCTGSCSDDATATVAICGVPFGWLQSCWPDAVKAIIDWLTPGMSSVPM
jgi:hypothetical protein